MSRGAAILLAIALAAPPPADRARRLFLEARTEIAAGRDSAAERKLREALRLFPGYVEAALALGALEARSGRSSSAIAAYRAALAGDPDRLEAQVALSNLLWDVPDRGAKAESLGLLDRAAAAHRERPDLLRRAAERWAEWGDPRAALDRLVAYRARVPPSERSATDGLRRRLLERVGPGAVQERPPEVAPLASPAASSCQIAQTLVSRGDRRGALAQLASAERLDPGFAAAPDLEGAILEAMGDAAGAKAAYSRAEALGSVEAPFFLARLAERAGHSGEARRFYRKYEAAAPRGVHAEEARAAETTLAAQARLWREIAAGSAAVLLLGAAPFLLRRRSISAGEWLARRPERAAEARPIIGRLRHEVVKHGGLLLEDGARAIEGGDDGDAPAFLSRRLFAQGGLVAEGRSTLGKLVQLAREDGFRLNPRRDPGLAALAAGIRDLERARRGLGGAKPGAARRSHLAAQLRTAAARIAASGPRLAALSHSVGATLVDFGRIAQICAEAARAQGQAPPELVPMGVFAAGPALRVLVTPGDWETIWRNLFANAIAAARSAGSAPARVAVGGERCRDASTGASSLSMFLADDVPSALEPRDLAVSELHRGLGVVAEVVRRNGGLFETAASPGPPYRKAVKVELPLAEEP